MCRRRMITFGLVEDLTRLISDKDVMTFVTELRSTTLHVGITLVIRRL